MNKKLAAEILNILEELYPDAKTELEFHTPFQLLVATILSAQSTDVQVNKITKKLFQNYVDATAFARASQEEMEASIKGVGLYRNKSKNLIATAKLLLERHQGKVPASMESLIQLPGVGRKTANVVLANAFQIPAIAVDTHVFRVSRRLGFSSGKTPDQVEMDLQKYIPKKKWGLAHHWLILHGRRVCHARKPDCSLCQVAFLCQQKKIWDQNPS